MTKLSRNNNLKDDNFGSDIGVCDDRNDNDNGLIIVIMVLMVIV